MSGCFFSCITPSPSCLPCRVYMLGPSLRRRSSSTARISIGATLGGSKELTRDFLESVKKPSQLPPKSFHVQALHISLSLPRLAMVSTLADPKQNCSDPRQWSTQIAQLPRHKPQLPPHNSPYPAPINPFHNNHQANPRPTSHHTFLSANLHQP